MIIDSITAVILGSVLVGSIAMVAAAWKVSLAIGDFDTKNEMRISKVHARINDVDIRLNKRSSENRTLYVSKEVCSVTHDQLIREMREIRQVKLDVIDVKRMLVELVKNGKVKTHGQI